jgi:hypothetical protein
VFGLRIDDFHRCGVLSFAVECGHRSGFDKGLVRHVPMRLDFEQNVSAGVPMGVEPNIIRLRDLPQERLIALAAFATVEG